MSMVCQQKGGAVFSEGIGSIRNTTFFNNTVSWGYGGGIYSSFGGSLNLTGCIFSRNSATLSDLSNNVVGQDLYLYDSNVTCNPNPGQQVTFCNGIGSISADTTRVSVTNCPVVGVMGTPGDSACPP
jgi:hypothetical protein